MAPTPRSPLDRAAFAAAWPDLRELVLDEWPGLEPAALEATGGDADAVVALVAEHTERTRAMTRRQLAELLELVAAPPPPREPRRPSARAASAGPSPVEPLDNLVRSLEMHLDDIARQVKQDVTPLAVNTARQHIGLALLLAGGIGLMIGLFLGALGYPQEPAGEAPDVEA